MTVFYRLTEIRQDVLVCLWSVGDHWFVFNVIDAVYQETIYHGM